MSKFFRKRYIPVFLVVILAAFLRFYNLSNSFVFTIDEEYHAYLAQSLINHPHFKLIGVSVSVDFYLGPLWTYITAFLLLISKGDPLILGYFVAGIGVATTFLVYLVGKSLFNQRVALLASLLYACLPLMVYFDQKFWNDSLIPFLSLGIILSLYKTKDSSYWWLLFAFLAGLVFHTHLSLLPYFFIAIYLLIKQFKKIPTKITLSSLVIFLVMVSPIIVFDITHNFKNLSAPLRFMQKSSQHSDRGANIERHLQILYQTFGRFWYLNPNASNADETNWGCTSLSSSTVLKQVDAVTTRTIPPIWLSAISALLFAWFFIKKSTWRVVSSRLLALSLLALMSFFIVFPGDALEYYLLGTFPLVVFLPALLYEGAQGFKKYMVFMAIIILSALGIFTILNVDTEFGMHVRKNLIQNVMTIVGNESFEENELGGCQQNAGWRYLFEAYGRTPNRSSADYFFSWLYPEKIYSGPVKYTILMKESRIYPAARNGGQTTFISEGGFNAQITKNE